MKTFMKKILFSAFTLLISLMSVQSQTLTLDAESGNRTTEQANCWAFGASSYSNLEFRISGNWSVRTNQLTSTNLGASWIKSPWMLPGKGNISMKTRLENDRGSTRAIVIQFVSYDADALSSSKEAKSKEFYTYNWPTPLDIKVRDLTVPVPDEIANSGKPYKIMISFIGSGGTSRAFADDVIIPGTYFSSPADNCLPKIESKDKDGDGINDNDDAYPDDKFRAFNNYLPTSSFSTLMFEDLWPAKGDYDFNDLVVDYKINRVTNASNQIVDILFTYKVKAIGAGFKNGFGVEFTGIPASAVYEVKGSNIKGNVHKFESNGLEAGTKHLTFIAFDNAINELPYAGGGVIGVNTTIGAPKQKVTEKLIILSLMKDGKPANGNALSLKELGFDQFNPFLIVNQIRGREVHLADKAPTALADPKLFNTSDDGSNEGLNRWYKSKNNFLPWALNVSMSVPYPAEKVNIQKGFPLFKDWVESNGVKNIDWYTPSHQILENLYK